MGAPNSQVQSTPDMQNPPQGKGAGISALQNPSDKTNPYVLILL